MSSHLSVKEILAKLEARIASHREQAAFHVQQEVHHREQGVFHTAEFEKLTAHYEAFKATATTAADLVQAEAPPPAGDDEDLGDRPMASRLIARCVEHLPSGEPFGASRVAAEVEKRYRDRLRKPLDVRTVAVTLTRLSRAGRIRRVREGKAHQEALYLR